MMINPELGSIMMLDPELGSQMKALSDLETRGPACESFRKRARTTADSCEDGVGGAISSEGGDGI